MVWFFYVIRKDKKIVYSGTKFIEAQNSIPEQLSEGEQYSRTTFKIFDENPDNRIAVISYNENATRGDIHSLFDQKVLIPLEDLELLVDKSLQNLRSSA